MTPPRLLVLWVPDWPVLAHARAGRLPEEAPIALVAKNEVVACSAAARDDGVRRGMRQREAQARSPRLHVLRYDPALDARAFEPLLVALEQSLPGLHPLRPGTVAVRARGPARYYGGEKAAAVHVLGVARELGAPGARVGIADGLFAAERAAKSGADAATIVAPGATPAFLAPLPITLIDEDPRAGTALGAGVAAKARNGLRSELHRAELVSLLPRLGIRTLGEFAELGADDVLARFGPAGARLHARAGGRDARPATPRIPRGTSTRRSTSNRRSSGSTRSRSACGRRPTSSSPPCSSRSSCAPRCGWSSSAIAARRASGCGCIRAPSPPPRSSTGCAGRWPAPSIRSAARGRSRASCGPPSPGCG
ncbi:DNA polymerase Y family protein [Pseudolysinimonas kribbensis]|uniref:DNA polymerase Y family protein n=1 Tax=Pseudolysinimonas kribbensis TaxID=433641 RepID=UPI0032AEB49A